MKVDEWLSGVRDAVSVRRVYADPVTQDGVTVVLAATVGGGSGAGHGFDEKGQEGEGGGFGLGAKPAGAYLIKESTVKWVPAVDVNRLVTAAAVVAIVYLISRARQVKARALVAAASAQHDHGNHGS
ncbi:sporulation protein [Saccharomonospora sp. NPDC006951]